MCKEQKKTITVQKWWRLSLEIRSIRVIPKTITWGFGIKIFLLIELFQSKVTTNMGFIGLTQGCDHYIK